MERAPIHQQKYPAGPPRAATCGYRTSVFKLYSRKVYGALDRDNLRNRRRLSSELIRTRLLIVDFVLAHHGPDYLETEAEKVAYFRELAVPEALIPGRVCKGIDPNSTTKRCFVDRFPAFFSAESDCSPGELMPTFVYCDSASRGLFHYITHLRSYEHHVEVSREILGVCIAEQRACKAVKYGGLTVGAGRGVEPQGPKPGGF